MAILRNDAAFFQEVEKRKPHYTLKVTIHTSYNKVSDVMCKVFLPRRVTERPYVVLRFTEDQARGLGGVGLFSIEGQFENAGRAITIRSERAYSPGLVNETSFGTGVSEHKILGEAWDLTITHNSLSSCGLDKAFTSGMFYSHPTLYWSLRPLSRSRTLEIRL
jgi:hypothetical protein